MSSAALPRPPLWRRLAWPLTAVALLAVLAATPTLASHLLRRGAVVAAAPAVAMASAPATPVVAPDEPWLDVEFDYLGALRTWPARAGSMVTDPFRGESEQHLLAAGRTVCTRAGDPGMDADGMLDLLGMDPHQTFVVVTEALDKLCPSQAGHLTALTTGS